MTIWTFRPPTVDEGPVSWAQTLLVRMTLLRGVTILGQQGTYRALRFPTQDEIRAADEWYQGGYEHQVDDAIREALINANIGVTEDNFSALVGSYGAGGYGEGPYGG